MTVLKNVWAALEPELMRLDKPTHGAAARCHHCQRLCAEASRNGLVVEASMGPIDPGDRGRAPSRMQSYAYHSLSPNSAAAVRWLRAMQKR